MDSRLILALSFATPFIQRSLLVISGCKSGFSSFGKGLQLSRYIANDWHQCLSMVTAVLGKGSFVVVEISYNTFIPQSSDGKC